MSNKEFCYERHSKRLIANATHKPKSNEAQCLQWHPKDFPWSIIDVNFRKRINIKDR